jgi:hypothetical protein
MTEHPAPFSVILAMKGANYQDAVMKVRLGLLVAAAAITLAIAAPASSVSAQETQQTTKTTAKKKVVVHKTHRVVRSKSAYPELEPYRSFGFKGEFPGSCAYDRAAGNCMIDLGYGRCMPCENSGGGFN